MNRIFATIAIGAFVLSACNQKAEVKEEVPTEKKAEKTNVKAADLNSNGIKIAYYNQNTVLQGFDFYVEADSTMAVKKKQYQQKLERAYGIYQEYTIDAQKRMDKGEISGKELPKVQEKIKSLETKIAKMEKEDGAALQEETYQLLNTIGAKITGAAEEYAKENNIEVLFSYQEGGQIAYISDAFNVTDEFTSYLNKRQSELITPELEEQLEETAK